MRTVRRMRSRTSFLPALLLVVAAVTGTAVVIANASGRAYRDVESVR